MPGLNTPTRRRCLSLLAAGAAIVASSAACLAQGGLAGQIGCAVAQKQPLDANDKQAIKQFAGTQATALASADAEASSRAREALLAPLACDGVSVAFRIEYTQALEPQLARLAAGADDRAAANALRVLGRLKTPGGEKPMSEALRSKQAVVRFAAASAYRDLLGLIATDPFGFPERNIDQLLDTLTQALKAESDPMAAVGLILAFDGGRASPALRARAMTHLAEALGESIRRVRANPAAAAAWAAPTLRAVDAIRLTLFDQLPAGNVDREFARKAVEAGGQTLAYARDLLAAGVLSSDPAAADQAAKMVGASEGLLVFAHNFLTSGKVGEQGLAGALTKAAADGNPDGFSAAISTWIGASGLLTKDPYKTRAQDFAPGAR